MPSRLLFAAVLLTLAVAGESAGRIGAAAPTIAVYPSAQTIPATGRLPGGASRSIALNEPIGGDDAALVVVSGARQVGLAVDRRPLGPIGVDVRFRHFVRFGSSLVPDALMPWDGGSQRAESTNQPLSIEVSVPHGTKPGTYRSTVTVTADSARTALPLAITVYNIELPALGQPMGSLLTVFGVGPQAYVGRVNDLFHHTSPEEIRNTNDSLFEFLSRYRIAPNSWGYGIPGASGYVASDSWWNDSAGNMIRELQAGQFPTLWIPLSTQRAGGKYIAGLSPFEPEKWCGYLGAVRQFWQLHGFLRNGAIPYAYPFDEPGESHTSLLARQATSLHRCFPGAKMLVTATPSPPNGRLYDGKGTDDVDAWAAVTWRYYGKFTNPAQQKHGLREHQYLKEIDKARARKKLIFAYTYFASTVPGVPSFRATEPLADPRMFLLWTALEGIDGILYGQGLTTYGPAADPLRSNVADGGEHLLIYPGDGQPIASARLEQIRSGIEDWEVFDVVRKRFGAAKVRSILGAHGLFSADAKGVKLACTIGCDLKARPPQAWPIWSHDWSTAGRIEAARRDALNLFSH